MKHRIIGLLIVFIGLFSCVVIANGDDEVFTLTIKENSEFARWDPIYVLKYDNITIHGYIDNIDLYEFPKGTIVTLTTHPEQGVCKWEINGLESFEQDHILIMNQNYEVFANYGTPCMIYSIIGQGKIVPGRNPDSNTLQIPKAVPESGWEFDRWVGYCSNSFQIIDINSNVNPLYIRPSNDWPSCYKFNVTATFTKENNNPLPPCVVPTDGMVITEDTTFCPGEYNLPSGISIGADNVELDCDGAKINGNLNLFNISDAKIQDCDLQSMNIEYSSNNKILRNNIGSLYLVFSNDNNLSMNNITGHFGFSYTRTSDNDIVFYNYMEFNNIEAELETFHDEGKERYILIAKNNWWGTTDCNEIKSKLSYYIANYYMDISPYLDAPYPYGSPLECPNYLTKDEENNCIIPGDGAIIIEDTTFCPGVYDLPNGIMIKSDGIELDCNGATLIGNPETRSVGIFTANDDVTIKNCIIVDYWLSGIWLELSSNCNVLNNEVGGADSYGASESIRLDFVHNSKIENNKIANANAGILLGHSDNNTVVHNNVENAGYGFVMGFSAENNISYNHFNGPFMTESALVRNYIIGNNMTDFEFGMCWGFNEKTGRNEFCCGVGGQSYENCPDTFTDVIQYNNLDSFSSYFMNVSIEKNWWGTTDCEEIQNKIYLGPDTTADFEPFLNAPYPWGNPIYCDDDGDGVANIDDSCPGTPVKETVNQDGCSCSQIDVPVRDCPDDQCEGTHWVDYPYDGYDICEAGEIIEEYSCEAISSTYSEKCTGNNNHLPPPNYYPPNPVPEYSTTALVIIILAGTLGFMYFRRE